MERIPLDDYEQFFDDILSKDQMRPSDELSLLLDEKNEYEYGLFSYINEEPKNRPDIIKNIKESKSKTPKFVSHIFFNPKLKDIKQIMKKKQKKILDLYLEREIELEKMKVIILIKKLNQSFSQL